MDKKKVGLCIVSGLILIGLFKEAPSLLFITIIFISYFIYRKKKKQPTVIKSNEHWGTTQTQYQNQSKEFNESREQTAASSQTVTKEVPKEIMECPICHQKNRVIIGKTNPICGRCRNPLNRQSSNENRNEAAFDIFNNSNPKIIVKNTELGFFEELSFSNFIAFLTSIPLLDMNVRAEGYEKPINEMVYNPMQKYEFMFFVKSNLDKGNIHFVLKNKESSLLITFSTVMLLVQSYKGSQQLFDKIKNPRYGFGVFETEMVGKVARLEDILLKPNLEFEQYREEYMRYTDMLKRLHEQQALTGEVIVHQEYGYGTVAMTQDNDIFISFKDPEYGKMILSLFDTELELVKYPRPKRPAFPTFKNL